MKIIRFNCGIVICVVDDQRRFAKDYAASARLVSAQISTRAAAFLLLLLDFRSFLTQLNTVTKGIPAASKQQRSSCLFSYFLNNPILRQFASLCYFRCFLRPGAFPSTREIEALLIALRFGPALLSPNLLLLPLPLPPPPALFSLPQTAFINPKRVSGHVLTPNFV